MNRHERRLDALRHGIYRNKSLTKNVQEQLIRSIKLINSDKKYEVAVAEKCLTDHGYDAEAIAKLGRGES